MQLYSHCRCTSPRLGVYSDRAGKHVFIEKVFHFSVSICVSRKPLHRNTTSQSHAIQSVPSILMQALLNHITQPLSALMQPMIMHTQNLQPELPCSQRYFTCLILVVTTMCGHINWPTLIWDMYMHINVACNQEHAPVVQHTCSWEYMYLHSLSGKYKMISHHSCK